VLYERWRIRPSGVALRGVASSRLMLRWLKTVVVSDEEKAPSEASGGDLEDDHC
jgi:hypothetical protein